MRLDVVAWTSLGLAAAGFLVVCLLAARRIALAREEHRVAEGETRLRPVALEILEGRAHEIVVDEDDAHVLAVLLGRYARTLAGEARGHIAAFFERQELVGKEVERLGDRHAWRRARAAFTLGDMSSAQAIGPLLGALGDPERSVRSAAARSLGMLGAAEAVEPLVFGLVDRNVPRAVAGQALLTIGAASLPRLRPLISHEDPEVRAVSVELVGLLGGASDAEYVIDRICDSSAEVRAKTCRALGRLGAAEATGELRAALVDRVPFVRATAAHALGAVGDREAGPALLGQAQHDEFDPAQAAARALARVDPQLLWRAARQPGGAGRHVAEAADLSAVRT